MPMLILQTLEQTPKHGYRIAMEIKAKSKGVLDFKEGTLYPTLHGLENKGYLKSSEHVEQGRTRIYYELTPRGREALDAERAQWRELSKAVRLVLEGA